MTKGLIIGGVPRAGKSTLARRVCREFGLPHIPGDPLIEAFGQSFPDLGIRHVDQAQPETARRVAPFLRVWWQGYLEDEGMGFVYESAHLLPSLIPQDGFGRQLKAIFLGYPRMTVDAMFAHLRSFPEEDEWTFGVADLTLRDWLAHFIVNSLLYANECQQAGIDFIDVGPDFQAAQERAYKIAAEWLKS